MTDVSELWCEVCQTFTDHKRVFPKSRKCTDCDNRVWFHK